MTLREAIRQAIREQTPSNDLPDNVNPWSLLFYTSAYGVEDNDHDIELFDEEKFANRLAELIK